MGRTVCDDQAISTIHEMAGQPVELLPTRALYIPESATLLVADLHLGKAAAYRRLGQPVPQGTTSETLRRLSEALASRPVKRLVVLGDFLHSAHVHLANQTLAAIAAWRQIHSHLAITLIRGNHDDKAGDPPPHWAIEVVDEPYAIGDFVCRHAYQADRQTREKAFTLAGHVHPVVTIKGRARERVRLVCFVVGPDYCLVPAFGAFTGGHEYAQNQHETLYAIAQERVFAVPFQRASHGRQAWP
jgi:DNA ligase-associated metallophosphoesterase